MRSRKVPRLWAFAVVVAAVAALACLSTWAPEFMGRIQDPELMSMDPATLNSNDGFPSTLSPSHF